jgi:hypothetical protein
MTTESDSNQVKIEINKQRRWWHDRRVRTIGISFTVLLLLAIALSLLLEFAILAPKESHSTTTTTTQPPGKF